MIVLFFLVGLFSIPALLGLFVMFHLFRKNTLPADQSNRINKIRLFWFCLTREDQIAEKIDWMKNDEWDNVNK
jgi:hypothetical protein